MIKNVLYSLFLHFIFITLIYANFNLQDVPKIEVKEISISLLEVKSDKSAKKEEPKEIKPIEKKKPIKKKEEKKKKPPKKQPKKEKKPKEQPKKEEKPKETKKEQPKKEEKAPTKKDVKKKILEDKPKKDVKDTKKEEKPKEPKKELPKKKEEPVKPEEKPKEEIKEEVKELTQEDQSVSNLENLNLSVREKFNIRSQLKMCYRRARAEHNLEESKFKITIIAEIAQDGFIYSNLDEMTDEDKYKHDRDYKTAINVVERALNLCSPLRNLPPNKYNVWKKVLLEFGENASKQTTSDETQKN